MRLRVPMFVSLFCISCGGSAPPPSRVDPAPAAAPAAPTQDAGPTAAEAQTGEPSESAPPPPAETVEKPSRPPVDVVAAPQTAFVINYPSSAVAEAAEKKCSAAGDPPAQAQCKKKERSEFLADVVEFKKDKSDNVTWHVHRRKGTTLVRLHKSAVRLTQKSENTVTVEIIDEDKHPRVLFNMKKKFDVLVPNDYSIVLDDPRYGKLTYEAKVGLVSK